MSERAPLPGAAMLAPGAAAGDAPALPRDILHGVALRPPAHAWDGRRYRGARLEGLHTEAARATAGIVAVVHQGSFAGVVAVTLPHARQAVAALAPTWQRPAQTPGGTQPQVESATSYVWRAPPPGVPVDAAVIAWCVEGQSALWLPACDATTLAMLRQELADTLGVAPASVCLVPAEAPAQTHPLAVLDAAVDAALLSQACGRPVRVACQVPAPVALRLDVAAASAATTDASFPATHAPVPAGDTPSAATGPVLLAQGPWAVRPSLARLLRGDLSEHAAAWPGVQPADGVRVVPGGQVSLDASVAELNAAQVFAQESQWCEDAVARDADPLTWRLQHVPEGPARTLARQVAERAQWHEAVDGAPATPAFPDDGRLHGRGFATTEATHHDADGSTRVVWSAWVAEVAVQPATGHIEVTRVVAGHDGQHLQAARGASTQAQILHQDPRLLDTTRLLLGPAPAFDDWRAARPSAAASRDLAVPGGGLSTASGTGPLATGALALDGVMTLPAAAAIANAIHDATGVRLRETPFDAAQLRLALAGEAAQPGGWLRRNRGWLAAGAASVAGLAAMAWPLKPALPLTAGPDISLYSAQAIERGRLVAAAGDCIACHTVPGGAPNAGGFGLPTPFGTIYSTNITPDNETGIGRWSYAAFERAMRQGIHQDGRQLYPAFPYTAFAKLSDGDIQSLYAYLMSQPAVKSDVPETKLAFPYSLRPAIAGWNVLFHDATPFAPEPDRTMEWNRGAYLVQGAGHCAACHSPRNALGAEKGGIHYLAGGEAEGWSAPALNQLATGALPWTRDEVYQYLRTGHSTRHGVAAGPMAPVIHGLAELPDSDVQAIATYLMELPGQAPADSAQRAAPTPAEPVTSAAAVATAAAGGLAEAAPSGTPATVEAARPDERVFATHVNGERIYQNACAACHEAGSGPTLFGVKPLLATNTNLHAASPDNLIQVIMHGIQNPAADDLGYMPGFADSLDDRQIDELVGYLRERFAPQEPAWTGVTPAIERIRATAHAHQD